LRLSAEDVLATKRRFTNIDALLTKAVLDAAAQITGVVGKAPTKNSAMNHKPKAETEEVPSQGKRLKPTMSQARNIRKAFIQSHPKQDNNYVLSYYWDQKRLRNHKTILQICHDKYRKFSDERLMGFERRAKRRQLDAMDEQSREVCEKWPTMSNEERKVAEE
jgi:hypothetical protein